jgi:hypothetical protein
VTANLALSEPFQRQEGRTSFFDPFDLNDFEHGKRRRQLFVALVIAGLAILIGLSAVVRFVGVPQVERHLKADIVAAVGTEVRGFVVEVDGRDVKIGGTVPTVRERTRIVLRIRERWGVGSVDAVGLQVR